MNSIDELPMQEKLEKLLRMMAMGRVDAAVKLAEVLADALLKPAPKKTAK